MGWAKRELSAMERESIFRALVRVEEEDGSELKCVCPFHGDTNPSLGYNVEEDVFHCFGCKASGDLIDFWAKVQGLEDKSEYFKTFKDEFGRSGSASPGKVSNGGGAHPGREAVKVISETVWEQMGPLPEEWIRELEKVRGWSREVIERFDIRQETVFLDQQGMSGGDDGTVKRVNSAPYRIAIPVRDDNGRLLNIRRYRKPGSKAKQKILSWGKGYGTARLFPAGSKLGEGNIYLCEGEPDTLCAFSRGLEAITQTSKTKQWSQSMLAPFRNRDVVICYDADRAGMEHAQSAANNLAKVAASVRILQWPPFMGQAANGNWPEGGGQDITDFFVTHGKSVQDLQELVAQARLVDKPEEEEASSSSARQFFAKGADNRTSFRPRLLAERIIKDCPLLYDPGTGLLYRWTGQFYELFHEDQVRLMAMHHLGLDAARDRVNDATFQVRILSIIPNGRQTNDQGGWICLKDGMLDLDTGSTAPHDKKYYATYQIPVEVNPTSTPRPERWLRFLEETIQTPEPIAQLQEFFGYCMTKDVRYEKCLMLIGPGGDGKSKIMSVLRHLVGAVNVSAVRFQDLENEFQRAAIYNKLVNMATELGSKAMESDIFKALVSGDYISAAYKHRDPFQFKPFCKLVFAMNRLPRVLDNSEGLFRKLLPIQFKRQFLEGDPARDPDLEEKLLRELPGIFEWALVGLARLRQQRQFTNCAETDELLGLYRVLNNPVAAFVEDNCAVGGHGSCEKGAIYTAYKEYCREGSYYPLGRENFFIELYSVLGSRQETRPSVAGKRERHVQGLILLVTSEGC